MKTKTTTILADGAIVTIRGIAASVDRVARDVTDASKARYIEAKRMKSGNSRTAERGARRMCELLEA